MRYSAFRVLQQALTGHTGWRPAWRDPDPKPHYDIVIIGCGGHGLATAYYLARQFGQANIAVLKKGWIGGCNVGRNTTIIRSNYMLDGNEPFYEFSLKLWEGLEQDFNYNAMVSQRGILNLIHSDAQRDAFTRRGNAMILNGADAELLNAEQVRHECPFLNFDNARFPIKGGLAQRRGGTVRHDAVAWGYARGADSRGVDIIQNCEVTGFRIENGKCLGVETSRGFIGAGKVGVAVAGNSSRIMAKAGMRLPIESHVLQAFVTEGLKPVLPGVITFGAGHFYCSQSDKGGLVFGGDLDGYNSYAQRGNLPVVEDVVEGGMALFPGLGRVRLLRMWGGIMDMSMDGSPIIDRAHIDGLYFNGGWCYGGVKATPASGWCFAHLLATDTPHSTATAYRFDRFERGRPVWQDDIAAFVPGSGLRVGMSVTEAAAGRFGTYATLADGAAQAVAALGDLDISVSAPSLPRAEDARYRITPFWHVGGTKRAWLDFQNDVTVKDVNLAHQEGFRAVEHLKRYTTLGMATDQGKTSSLGGLAVMAELTGQSIEATGATIFRPPSRPWPWARSQGGPPAPISSQPARPPAMSGRRSKARCS